MGGDVSDRESVVNGGDVDEGPVDEKKTEEAVLHKQVREAKAGSRYCVAALIGSADLSTVSALVLMSFSAWSSSTTC